MAYVNIEKNINTKDDYHEKNAFFDDIYVYGFDIHSKLILCI